MGVYLKLRMGNVVQRVVVLLGGGSRDWSLWLIEFIGEVNGEKIFVQKMSYVNFYRDFFEFWVKY